MTDTAVVPRCANDPSRAAVAFCTSCIAPFSRDELGIRVDGRAMCHTCAAEQQVRTRPYPGSSTVDPVLSAGWVRAVGRVAFRPNRAMATRYDGPIRGALGFGYLATLIAYAATHAWNLALHGDALVAQVRESGSIPADMSDASVQWAVLLSAPVLAAIRFGLGALLLDLGIRAVVGDASDRRANLRVFGLASGTLVFCVVPSIGWFVAMVTWISLCMAHLSARHGILTFRGMLALLPSLLVLSLLGPRPFVDAG